MQSADGLHSRSLAISFEMIFRRQILSLGQARAGAMVLVGLAIALATMSGIVSGRHGNSGMSMRQ